MLFFPSERRKTLVPTVEPSVADARLPVGSDQEGGGDGGGGLLLVHRVQVAPDQLVHLEHVDLGLLEHGRHLFVAEDLALVLWVLQLVALDVLPELLDDLGARELATLSATTPTQEP